MISISATTLTILFAAFGAFSALIGAAIGYGRRQAATEALEKTVAELKAVVGELREDVTVLRVALARIEGRQEEGT